MQYQTTVRSYPAIVGGSLSAIIAWLTLTRGVDLAHLTLDHAQSAALVGLTVLSGHLGVQAFQQLRLLSAAGLVGLSVLGSALVIANGMGARAEVRDVRVAQVSMSDAERARISADLAKTSKLVEQAEAWVMKECKSGVGPECKGMTFILNQRKASEKALQAQLHEVGPTAVAEPKAHQAALLAGLAGYNRDTVKQVVSAIEPLMLPLFFEFMAIIMFSVGLGSRATVAAVVAKPEIKALDFSEAATLTDPELEALRKLLLAADRPLTNNEVATLLNCHKGESSKRVSKAIAAGMVSRHRVGKEVAISLH